MKIVLKVVNKRIFVDNEFKIVNNNTDYTIKFVFDKEWSDIDNKTLRIEFENGNYIDTPFTGDTVALPQISNQNSFRLGVYAGDIHSTSILAVSCEKSILDGGGCEYIIKPTESIEITDTEEVDVTHYATAQVVDENLIPGNIRKGANILGVEGAYEPENPKLYRHNIWSQYAFDPWFYCTIISRDPTPFTLQTFLSYMASKHSGINLPLAATGGATSDGGGIITAIASYVGVPERLIYAYARVDTGGFNNTIYTPRALRDNVEEI